MRFPSETVLAFFPPCRTAGNVTLRPLTLAGAVELSGYGIEPDRPVPDEKLALAAFVLSRPSPDDLHTEAAFDAFLAGLDAPRGELAAAVEDVLTSAAATYVPPKQDPKTPPVQIPRGFGWPLELADFLASEYGWSWERVRSTSVATAWALLAATRRRCGVTQGCDYYQRIERARIVARRREREGR